MKTITLKTNGTFEHLWLKYVHSAIPDSAIDVSDDVFMLLSQDPEGKIYDPATGIVSNYVRPTLTVEEIRVSMQCAAWKFKRALTKLGMRAEIESMVASADQDTKDMWAGATNFKRTSQFILNAATVLNKTPEDVDAVFSEANAIEE
ncbi:MAG: hypothetical protein ACXWT0_00010 [Methylobacter sp.]